MRGVLVALGLVVPACGFSVSAGGDAVVEDARAGGEVEIPVDGPRTDWWNAAYPRRRAIRIDTSSLTETLVDFPLRITLPATFDFASALATGADLRFVGADHTTVYPYEIDTYGPTGATVWVKVTATPTAAPATLWLYYGNAAATPASNGPAVFGAYATVNHLDAALTDSSGHQHTVTQPSAAGAHASFVPGLFGEAGNFDGDDFLVLANSADMNFTTTLTATAWIKLPSFPGGSYQCVVCKSDGAWRMHRSGALDAIGFGTTSGSSQDLNGDAPVANDQWHHIAVVMDGAKKHVYIDGVEDTVIDYARTLDQSTAMVRIGSNQQFSAREWKGLIDEVRVTSIARSRAWLAAETLTGLSPAVLTLGAVELY